MEKSEVLLALAHPGVAFLIGILLALVARFEQKQGYFLGFAGAFVFYGAGVLMQTLLVPRHLPTNITVAGLVYLLAALLFCRGLLQLAARSVPWAALVTLIGLSTVLRAYFTFAEPDSTLRAGVLQLSLFAMMAMTSWQIRHLRLGLIYERLLFWLVLGLTSSFILLAIMLIGRDATQYGYDGSRYWLAVQASFYAFNVLIALVLLLVAAGRAIHLARQASYLDPLTRTNNRTGFRMRMEASVGECHRYGLIALDIDHFKGINDRYGHATGDAVLKAVGELLTASLRPQDVLARYGGEEFLVFLPGAGADEADRIGIRLCQVLEDLNLSALAPDLTLTASAGVATFSADVLLELAYAEVDYLLYEAKAAGRNQVWNRQGRIAPAQGGSGDAAGDPLSPQAWRYQSQSGIAHRP